MIDLGVPGVLVGHWTDATAMTGCTVVLLPEGTVASGEVRGGAPATREVELLAPERLVSRCDAVLLTGGSAFGLGATDGVLRWCERAGRGYATVGGVVPIVPALAIYDLAVGDPAVRPGPDDGEAACLAATEGPVELGAVGAGTGATVATWRGLEHRRPGGIGGARVDDGDVVVAALAVVNAYGSVLAAGEEPGDELPPVTEPKASFTANTTIGVVLTNARLDKLGCLALAQGAHDGLARAVHPPHTAVDGDAVVAAATGPHDAPVDRLRAMAVHAFATAVRSAVPVTHERATHVRGSGRP